MGVTSTLLTCDDDNVGSAAVIERCGGVREAVTLRPDGAPPCRYWLPTT
jgi:predicted acetyltransferase